jgi:hypothetical protein
LVTRSKIAQKCTALLIAAAAVNTAVNCWCWCVDACSCCCA